MKSRLAESVPVEPGPRVERRRPVSLLPGDEINLADYAATCWRYRYVILAAVMLTAGVSYVANRRMQPIYEASVRLLATESKVIDDVTSRAISVARFRELLESPSLVAAVLTEFNLTSPPHRLTARQFLAHNLSVSEIPDTGILQASIRLTDPGLLVKLADRYAVKAVDLAARLNQDETVYARDLIKVQADEARKTLSKAQNELEEFRKKTQIELLRRDVDAVLLHRPDVVALQVDIETERAQLRQAEIELSRQERVRDTRRSLDVLPDAPASAATPPVAGQPAKPGGNQPGRPATGTASAPGTIASPSSGNLQVRSELMDPYVNPVYEVLARDVAQARARLAGLERRRQQLVNELHLSAPTNVKLNALYRAEAELTRLTGEYDVARNAYINAASKYEEARLQITVRSPRLQILDLAQPPERPVAPNIPRNVAAAAMIALTIGVIAVLVVDSARRRP